MIALLCPTRGRPDKFKAMVASVVATTSEIVTVYAILQSEEDIKSYDVEHIMCENGNKKVELITFTITDVDCPTVHLWNKLAELAHDDKDRKHSMFMLASDDIIFSTKGWDVELIKLYNALDNKIHVFSLQDSRIHDDGMTLSTPHPIVTREYMHAMNYFLPPLFLHWYVDTWTVSIARHNSVFTHLPDFLCTHDKIRQASNIDETHVRLRKRGWRERDRYVNNTCRHLLSSEKLRLQGKLMA